MKRKKLSRLRHKRSCRRMSNVTANKRKKRDGKKGQQKTW